MGNADLLWNLTLRQLRDRYRRSIFGLLWSLLNPLISSTVYFFVLSKIFRVNQDHYFLMVLLGVIFWNFFTQSIMESLSSLVTNASLLTRIKLPLAVFQRSAVLGHWITFCIAYLFLFCPLWIFSEGPHVFKLLWSLFVLIVLSGFPFLLGSILSVAFVFFSDVAQLTGVFFQLALYASPIFYSRSLIPEQYQWLYHFNPIAMPWFEIQNVLFMNGNPSLGWMTYVIPWYLGLGLLALAVDRTLHPRVVESL